MNLFRLPLMATAILAHTATATLATEWDVSLWGERRAFTEHVEKLAELVSEKTNGEFTLNLNYGGLAPSRENLDGIAAGDFEMAQFCAGYHPEKNPTITVLELPFLGVETLEQEIALSLAVYRHPITQIDMLRWNATLLMPSPLPQYNILGTGNPPTSIDDFKDLPVRATGGVAQAMGALGAELVSIPAPQVQEALKSGEVRAVSFAPHAHMSFGTVDSGVWWTSNLNPGTVNCPVVVNSKAMGALPDDHREALMSSVDEALDHYVQNYNGTAMAQWDKALVDNGIVVLTLRDDIVESIKSAVAEPAAETWVTEYSARGIPAQDLLDIVTTHIQSTN